MSDTNNNKQTADQVIINLLILSDNQPACNRLISRLRDSGLALNSAVADSQSSLAQCLSAEQWDVLVYLDQPALTATQALELLKKHQQDTPLILSTTEHYPEEELPRLYEQGISDIVPAGQTEKLQISVMREASRYALLKQLRSLEIAHQELKARHQLLLEDSPVAVSYIRDGVHLYCNPSYTRIFGYPDSRSISTTPLLNLFSPECRPAVKALLADAEESARQATLTVLRHDGSTAELQVGFTAVDYDGKPCLQMTVQHPAGNEAFSEELSKISAQDLLTSLENSETFMLGIEQAIRNAIRRQQFSALVLVELNEYQDICAALGKNETNQLLNDTATILKAQAAQALAIGRLQEQVFGILLPQSNPDEILEMATALKKTLDNQMSGTTPSSMDPDFSVGLALINGHALNAADVINRARLSLQQEAAASGSALFRIGESLSHDTQDMLNYLEQALQEKRFNMVYQPIVGINGNNQQYYEVLIRMRDKDDNEILPGAFLPLATMNGLGEELDRMVVLMTLDALQSSPDVQRLSVNITNNTLTSPTFLPWLSEQLREKRISANRLGIDVSEISLHSYVDETLAFCQGLEVLGVTLTISHFGGAVEPFTLLDKLKPDLVTLDENLVRDLIYSPQQKSAVQSIISTLHSRKLPVVTPRVEDMAVLPVLWELGVDFVQGYCLQAPSNEMNYEFVQDEEITLSAPSQ